MGRALNLLTIPKTETLRALSQHFKKSITPYEEHLHSLAANQEPLMESWQGEGTEAYVQSNGQLVSIGGVHVEQMQEAASICESTADLLDEGSRTQNEAEALWRQAKALEALGQFEAAAPIEASAHATQATALVTLTTARTTFNTGFAALTARMASVPSMTGETFNNYQVTGGHEKTFSKGPLTPPATPPPSKPASSNEPKSTLTQTSPPASQPTAGNPASSGADDDTAFVDALTLALKSTPEGREALNDAQQYGVKVHIRAGGGSSYDPVNNTVILEQNLPFSLMVKNLIHEITHAWYAKTVKTANTIKDEFLVYKEKMLNEEVVAEGNAIRDHLRRNGYHTTTPLEKEYLLSYNQGVYDEKTNNPKADDKQLHEAGLLRAHTRLLVAFKSGEVLTATTGESYEEYYRKQWEVAQTQEQFTVIRPAPGGSPDQQAVPQSRTAVSQEERASGFQRMDPSSTTSVPTTRIARLEHELNELDELKNKKYLEYKNIENTIKVLKEKDVSYRYFSILRYSKEYKDLQSIKDEISELRYKKGVKYSELQYELKLLNTNESMMEDIMREIEEGEIEEGEISDNGDEAIVPLAQGYPTDQLGPVQTGPATHKRALESDSQDLESSFPMSKGSETKQKQEENWALSLTMQQKLLLQAERRGEQAKQHIEELDQLKQLGITGEELWESIKRAENSLDLASSSYELLMNLGEDVTMPAFLTVQTEEGLNEGALGEARDAMDLVQPEPDLVAPSPLSQQPPFEQVIKVLPSLFVVPSYLAADLEHAGGKRTQVMLGPGSYLGLSGELAANLSLRGLGWAQAKYPQAELTVSALLNTDFGGESKDANLTIVTLAAQRKLLAFENHVRYALAGLYNLYRELHKDPTQDISELQYGIKLTIQVSDGKWSDISSPEEYIARTISCEARLMGTRPQFKAGSPAERIHTNMLISIGRANKIGRIDNTWTAQQARPSQGPSGTGQAEHPSQGSGVRRAVVQPKTAGEGQTQLLNIKERPEVYARLDKRLREARATAGVEKRTSTGLVTGGTIAVAETDLPLERKEFVAGSANAGKWFDNADGVYDLFPPPADFGSAQNHAEQGLVGKISQAIERAGLEDEALEGHTVSMHVDQSVCSVCKAGLGSLVKPGVLKQFSQKYPALVLEITNQENDEFVRLRGGRRMATLWSPLSVQKALLKPPAKALPKPRATKSSRAATASKLLSQIASNELRPLFTKDGAAMIKDLDDKELNNLYKNIMENWENPEKTLVEIRAKLKEIIQTLQGKIEEMKKGPADFLTSFKDKVKLTAIGQAALGLADHHEISVIRGQAGGGSSYDWDQEGQFTVVIDPEEQKDSALIHQIRRVDALLETDSNKYTREKYVQVMIDQEVDAYARALRHNIELAGPPDRKKLALQDEFKQASGNLQAKIQSIRAGYGDRAYRGGTYTSYYEGLWDENERNKLKTQEIQDGEETDETYRPGATPGSETSSDSDGSNMDKPSGGIKEEKVTESSVISIKNSRGKYFKKLYGEAWLEKQKNKLKSRKKEVKEIKEKIKILREIDNKEDNIQENMKRMSTINTIISKTRNKIRVYNYNKSQKVEDIYKIADEPLKATDPKIYLSDLKKKIKAKRRDIARNKRILEQSVEYSERAKLKMELQEKEKILESLLEEKNNDKIRYSRLKSEVENIEGKIILLEQKNIQEKQRLEQSGKLEPIYDIKRDIGRKLQKRQYYRKIKTKVNKLRELEKEIEELKDKKKDMENVLEGLKSIKAKITREKEKLRRAKARMERLKTKKQIETNSDGYSSNTMEEMTESIKTLPGKSQADLVSKKRQAENAPPLAKRAKVSGSLPIPRTTEARRAYRKLIDLGEPVEMPESLKPKVAVHKSTSTYIDGLQSKISKIQSKERLQRNAAPPSKIGNPQTQEQLPTVTTSQASGSTRKPKKTRSSGTRPRNFEQLPLDQQLRSLRAMPREERRQFLQQLSEPLRRQLTQIIKQDPHSAV